MRTRTTVKIGAASLALAWFTAIGWAADNADSLAALKSMSLEDLTGIQVETVVGASKHEQKTTEAPSSVSIVTQDEIKKQGRRLNTNADRKGACFSK